MEKLRKQSGKQSGLGRQLRQRGVKFGVGQVVSGKQRFMEVFFVQTVQTDDEMIRAGKGVLLFFFSFFSFFIRIVRTCFGKFVHHAAPQLLDARNREVRCHDEQQKEGEKTLHIKDFALPAAKVTILTGKPGARQEVRRFNIGHPSGEITGTGKAHAGKKTDRRISRHRLPGSIRDLFF